MLPLKLILVPIDFSDASRASLDAAVDIASRMGAELLLVHVVPEIRDLPVDISIFKEGEHDQILDDSEAQRLTAVAATLAHTNIKFRTEMGRANDVGMELLRIAAHNHVDMIVIATHGMTGWRTIPFGSVAEKVVNQAECPVLVLRTKAAQDASTKDNAAASASAV
jgi:nucleotide-binding universal stress UspA family protein